MTKRLDEEGNKFDSGGTLPVVPPCAVREGPPGSRIQVFEDSPESLVLCILARGNRETRALWASGLLSLLSTVGSVTAIILFGQRLSDKFHIMASLVSAVFVSLLLLTIKAKFERTFLLLERDRLVVQRVLLGFKRKSTIELFAGSRAQIIGADDPEVTTDGVKVTGRNQALTFGNLLSANQNRWLVERINEFLKAGWSALPTDAGTRTGPR